MRPNKDIQAYSEEAAGAEQRRAGVVQGEPLVLTMDQTFTPKQLKPGTKSLTGAHATTSSNPLELSSDRIRGNRLPNTTCLTQVLFKSGEATDK